MTQKMEEDRLVRENDSEEENPYQSMIANDFGRVNFNLMYHKWNSCQYLAIT